MEKVIEKGKVYGGRYFLSYAYLALEDSFNEDDVVSFIDLKTGKKSYEFAHQLEEMQEDYANEYLFSDLPDDFYGENNNEFDLEKNAFKIHVNSFLDTDKSFQRLQEYSVKINDAFYRHIDRVVAFGNYDSKDYKFDEIQKIRNDQKKALDFLYEKAVLII